MISVPWLTWIGGLIVVAIKTAWEFARRRAQIVLLWFTVFLPKILNLIKQFRLSQITLLGVAFYAIYSLLNTIITTVSQFVYTGVGIASIAQRFSWAGWLLWQGPLALGELWSQLVSCLSFYGAMRVIAWKITRLDWFVSLVKNVLGRF